MKLLKILTAFLLLAALQIAAAQWLHVPPPVEARNLMVVGGGVPVTGGTSYLLSESFDGSTSCATTYSETCTNTWTATVYSGDTLSFNNTSAPAPLEGTYSLRMTSSTDVANETEIVISISAASTFGAYFIANFDGIGTTQSRELFRAFNGATQLFALYRSSAANSYLNVWDGATSGSNSFVIDPDTTYHIWVDWAKGTGANSTINVYISANSTKPGSPEVTSSAGDATLDANMIQFVCNRQTNQVLDKIRISSSAIGSDPS